MAQRRMAVAVLIACFCLWLMPCSAAAASTSDATEPIRVNEECALTLSYLCDGVAFEGVAVKLYQVADVSSDFRYGLTAPFEETRLVLNGVLTQGEWNEIRSTLEAHVIAKPVDADATANTKEDGTVSFEGLKPGLYLALVGRITQGERSAVFDSALISLPSLGEDGRLQYRMEVKGKGEILPPSQKETERKILKLWKGDEGKNSRPNKIEIEIFKDGQSYETVLLSEENQWSYRWTTKDDGAKWTVVERSVLPDYIATVEVKDETFLLTNTYTPENPEDPPKDPQTGDTSNRLLYEILLIGSGSLLILLGIMGKRFAHEENK